DLLAFAPTEHELELLGLDDEQVTRSGIDEALGRIADREALQAAAADRTHYDQPCVALDGEIDDRALRFAAQHVHACGHTVFLDFALQLLAHAFADLGLRFLAASERISGVRYAVNRIQLEIQL